MKKRKIFIGIILLAVMGIYLNNATWLISPQKEEREILAHRGLHQTFDPTGITNKTCTASRIEIPHHAYLENTLPSIQAAINLGADIVEFDIHPTIDGEFVVFHDWELECRTNGKGVVREQTVGYLKSLDIGFGYTADNGKTYPFRGKYIGAMPTLGEVLSTFPETKFLINIKSNSTEEVHQLTNYLRKQEQANRKYLSVYGGGKNITVFSKLNPDMKTLSKQKAKSCIKSYVFTGWSGYMPKDCHNSLVPIPENYQWLIWGWPNRFEARLEKVNSQAVLMGENIKGKANSGIDNLESFKNIPSNFKGIIFTNRIDLIGKHH